MGKVLWYMLPGWTPAQAAWRVYQYMVGAGERRAVFTQPSTVSLKRGGLILWEGEAKATAFENGGYIGFRIETSKTTSFLKGGLYAAKKAENAGALLERYIRAALGEPVSVSEY